MATLTGLHGALWLSACAPHYGSTPASGFGELGAYAEPVGSAPVNVSGAESPQYLYQYGGDAAARQAQFTPAGYVSDAGQSDAGPGAWRSPAAFHMSRHGRDGAETLVRQASLAPASYSSAVPGEALAQGRVPADGDYRLSMPLSSAMVMCRSAMSMAGWERHPDYDVFRRGPAQVAMRLMPVGAATMLSVKSGTSLISDEAWQAALAKKAAPAAGEAKPEGDKDKEKK